MTSDKILLSEKLLQLNQPAKALEILKTIDASSPQFKEANAILIEAQRHLKVVGIFARLSLRDGKHGYLNDIPLVFKYLLDEIKGYAVLQPFYQWVVTKIVPPYLQKNPQAVSYLAAHRV